MCLKLVQHFEVFWLFEVYERLKTFWQGELRHRASFHVRERLQHFRSFDVWGLDTTNTFGHSEFRVWTPPTLQVIRGYGFGVCGSGIRVAQPANMEHHQHFMSFEVMGLGFVVQGFRTTCAFGDPSLFFYLQADQSVFSSHTSILGHE